MPDKLLEVKHLKKYFNTKNGLLHAVDDVSFDIERGETLGLVGESGCGKSTIGRAILRLHEPTSGEVLLNGVDVTKLNKQELRALRQKMQIVFQDPYSSLDGRKSVFESIGEPLVIQKVCKSKKEYVFVSCCRLRYNSKQVAAIALAITRTIRQAASARDFSSSQEFKSAGLAKKIRR